MERVLYFLDTKTNSVDGVEWLFSKIPQCGHLYTHIFVNLQEYNTLPISFVNVFNDTLQHSQYELYVAAFDYPSMNVCYIA